MTTQLRIGIDIGGTFTDAVAVTPQGIFTAKVPSNSAAPSLAVLAAVEALRLEQTPDHFLHGTTLITNMLLERKGAATGFLTSKGMRDVLHIGRHERPLTYAIKQEIPQQHHPPAPRKWRYAVGERIDASGDAILPLAEQEIRQAARQLAAEGVEAIAIGFLHAYRFPQHERLAEAWVKEEAPDVFVCTSSEVSPRFREYERFLTTAWNARVAPGAARYLADLARELDERWPGLALTLMTSNGGLEAIDMQSDEVMGDLRRTPIRLGLSGPAAAGNAVARVAKDLDLQHCVGLDVGGTSSDIVVIRDGRLGEAPWEERRIGGYPLQIPMLDLHTIGAGGGSLVHRDEYGALHVGPQSAGANPGPACYDRGGTAPTVTDAAALVGRLPHDLLLGGTLPIHVALAQDALASTFKASGADLCAAALNVLALAEANIAFGIRERTVARGLDPSELALVAAGGAGPLLACGVADVLQLSEVVVPPRPGLLAAWGLLVAPERREAAVTILRLLTDISSQEARSYFEEAEAKLSSAPPMDATLLRTAAMRYLGQGFEVEILVEDTGELAAMESSFHAAHAHEYGFAMKDAQVEWVELRVAWEVPADAWSFGSISSGNNGKVTRVELWEISSGDGAPQKVSAQKVDREQMHMGSQLPGPAIVMEQDATTYIPSGWLATVTNGIYLRIKKHEQ